MDWWQQGGAVVTSLAGTGASHATWVQPSHRPGLEREGQE